jgi:hypothetical protein
MMEDVQIVTTRLLAAINAVREANSCLPARNAERARHIQAASLRLASAYDGQFKESRSRLETAVLRLTGSGWTPSFVRVVGDSDTEANFNKLLGWWARDDDHGAGFAFLRALATRCGLEEMAVDLDHGEQPEVRVEEGSRESPFDQPDLLVMTSNAALMIEDKVNACEGKRQYARYLESFRAEAGARRAVSVLLSRSEREKPRDWTGSLLHADIAALLRNVGNDLRQPFWTRVAAIISATAFEDRPSPLTLRREADALLARTRDVRIGPRQGHQIEELALAIEGLLPDVREVER